MVATGAASAAGQATVETAPVFDEDDGLRDGAVFHRSVIFTDEIRGYLAEYRTNMIQS